MKKAPLKTFVEHWQRLGPELERIHLRDWNVISNPGIMKLFEKRTSTVIPLKSFSQEMLIS